jgi:hypothetical protein
VNTVGCFLQLASSCAAGAEQTGSVVGRVVDPEGGAIEQASVVLTGMSELALRYEATTNQSGDFRFLDVTPGTYSLKISSPGFKNESVADIRLGSGESRDLKSIVLRIPCLGREAICDDFGLGHPHTQATVDVPVNCGVDADDGKMICETAASDVDFRVRTGNDGEIYLSPANGARLALDTHYQWTRSDCENASYSATEVRIDQIKLGYRVCVHTSGGRYAEVYGIRKSDKGAGVRMSFVTW